MVHSLGHRGRTLAIEQGVVKRRRHGYLLLKK
jgi:hypothetical protein